jgi:hypothetical protein
LQMDNIRGVNPFIFILSILFYTVGNADDSRKDRKALLNTIEGTLARLIHHSKEAAGVEPF